MERNQPALELDTIITEMGVQPGHEWKRSDQGTTIFVYYHQYLVTASYTSSGGAPPAGSVVLTGTQFGHTVHFDLTTTSTGYWLDAGKTWSVPTTINFAGHSWTASGTTSGTVNAVVTVKPTYTRH